MRDPGFCANDGLFPVVLSLSLNSVVRSRIRSEISALQTLFIHPLALF
jgi:hypothetical protein